MQHTVLLQHLYNCHSLYLYHYRRNLFSSLCKQRSHRLVCPLFGVPSMGNNTALNNHWVRLPETLMLALR